MNSKVGVLIVFAALSDIVDDAKRAGEVIHRLRALLTKGEVKTEVLRINEVIAQVMTLVNADLISRRVRMLGGRPSISEIGIEVEKIRGFCCSR